MAALKLPTEQAELAAERLSWAAGAIMEEASDWAGRPMLDALDRLEPFHRAIRELLNDHEVDDVPLLRPHALEYLQAMTDSLGKEIVALEKIRDHRVEYFGVPDSQEESIKQQEEYIARLKQESVLADQLWATIRRWETEQKAAAGDPRAAEGLETDERWAREREEAKADAPATAS